MEKITLNTRMFYMVMVAFTLLGTASCTQDSSEESLYETQAKKTFSPTDRPDVDKRNIRTKPDRAEDDTIVIGSHR